jgi:membrane protein DedA with SNARE-associated domain
MTPMHDYQVDNLISIIASFVVVLTVTLLVLRAWRRAFDAQQELRRQLIDKMTSEELARILANEDGRRSIGALLGEDETRGTAGASGRGAMFILIGFALGFSAMISHLPMVGAAGLVAIAAGIGQLVTAWLMMRDRRK